MIDYKHTKQSKGSNETNQIEIVSNYEPIEIDSFFKTLKKYKTIVVKEKSECVEINKYELIGKALVWFYESEGYIDISKISSSGTDEMQDIVDMYLMSLSEN